MAGRRLPSLFRLRLICASASTVQGIAFISSSPSQIPAPKRTILPLPATTIQPNNNSKRKNDVSPAPTEIQGNDCTEDYLYKILTDDRREKGQTPENWVDYDTQETKLSSPSLKRDAHKISKILREVTQEKQQEDYSVFEKNLSPFLSILNPQLVCRVIGNCSIRQALPVVSFFLWANRQPGYKHNSTTCDAIIHFAAHTRDFYLMARLMKECKRWGISFTPKTFNFIIDEGGTLRHDMLDGVLRAINGIHEWKREGNRKGHDAHDALLSALCNGNQLDSALQVLRSMGSSGFLPTAHTCNIVVAALCREGRLEDAKVVIRDMKKKGCGPNVITYNRLLKGYIERRTLREASELMDAMNEDRCAADSFTYTQLIDVACRNRMPEMGLKLLRKMLYSGLKPMQAAYDALIDCFQAMGEVDEAEKLLLEMEIQGYERTVSCL